MGARPPRSFQAERGALARLVHNTTFPQVMTHRLRSARCVLALLVASPALAQTSAPQAESLADVKRAPTARHAGTYHLATSSWVRRSETVARFGQADNIYSNSADAGYFSATVGPTGVAGLGSVVDEAGTPSSSNPGPFEIGGARDANLITSIRLGYCDFETTPGVSGWRFVFYDNYEPCTYPPTGTSNEVVVSGLPTNGCWTLDLDLGGGMEFVLQSDGGDGFGGASGIDTFGIEWSYAGTGTADAGLRIAGDPGNTDPNWSQGATPTDGSNTYYGTVGGCATTAGGLGTGYLNQDFYWIEQGPAGGLPAGSNCYFFGGYQNLGPCGAPQLGLYGGYLIELSGVDATEPGPISDAGCVGAPNSTGANALFTVVGDPDPSANEALLRADQMPVGSFAMFVTGLEAVPAATLNIGSGWLCINPLQSGGVGRFDGLSQVKLTGASGSVSLDTAAGEWDLGSIPTSAGLYSATAGVTSYFQAWYRDGASFNFSDSASVTWQ